MIKRSMNNTRNKVLIFIKLFLLSVLLAAFIYKSMEQPMALLSALTVLSIGLVVSGIVATRDKVKRE